MSDMTTVLGGFAPALGFGDTGGLKQRSGLSFRASPPFVLLDVFAASDRAPHVQAVGAGEDARRLNWDIERLHRP
jgi:hypothetical protein